MFILNLHNILPVYHVNELNQGLWLFFLETMSQEWFLDFLIGEKQPKEKEYFVTQEKLHEI